MVRPSEEVTSKPKLKRREALFRAQGTASAKPLGMFENSTKAGVLRVW